MDSGSFGGGASGRVAISCYDVPGSNLKGCELLKTWVSLTQMNLTSWWCLNKKRFERIRVCLTWVWQLQHLFVFKILFHVCSSPATRSRRWWTPTRRSAEPTGSRIRTPSAAPTFSAAGRLRLLRRHRPHPSLRTPRSPTSSGTTTAPQVRGSSPVKLPT